jgi:hypothetical protein
MKRRVLIAIGLTAVVLPGIAPAQNAVTEWNNIAATTALAGNAYIPANSPNGASLYLAYVHLAIHDAVNAIQHRYKSYGPPISAPPGASLEAAVAAAAYTMLRHHFPTQTDELTLRYKYSLATISDGDKQEGVNVGRTAAKQIIDMRAGDGHDATVPYTYPSVPTPGVWIPTPPGFAPPVTPWMSQMMPFTMTSASQFFPEPPYSLSSMEWVDDYNEVKTFGATNSTLRTAKQTETALFWTENTAAQYARALRNLAGARNLDNVETARLFALVWTSSADALIGCWNAKFTPTYSFWRPVTAIRNGDIDGNDGTAPDPKWTPLATTPGHPEYPSAHGCFTGALAGSLQQYFAGQRFTFILSSTVTNTVHEIHSMEQLGQEVQNARVWAGIHYHHSVVQGADLGAKVAAQAFRDYFQPESAK